MNNIEKEYIASKYVHNLVNKFPSELLMAKFNKDVDTFLFTIYNSDIYYCVILNGSVVLEHESLLYPNFSRISRIIPKKDLRVMLEFATENINSILRERYLRELKALNETYTNIEDRILVNIATQLRTV